MGVNFATNIESWQMDISFLSPDAMAVLFRWQIQHQGELPCRDKARMGAKQ